LEGGAISRRVFVFEGAARHRRAVALGAVGRQGVIALEGAVALVGMGESGRQVGETVQREDQVGAYHKQSYQSSVVHCHPVFG